MKFEFSRQICQKKLKIKFLKICPVGAELFHADGRRTDMTKLYSRFSEILRKYKNYFGMYKQPK